MKNCIYVNTRQSEESRIIVVDEKSKLYGFEQEIAGQENIKGDIYKGVVSSVETSLEAAFVDLGIGKNGFLPIREISRSYGKVSPGDSVLVQVKKDHSGDKGAGLTTFITLTGNYLVLDPQRGNHSGVSKNLDWETREKMQKIITQLDLPEEMSVIIRTAAMSCSLEELSWDLHSYLLKLWGSIAEVSASEKGPALIYRENNLLLRTVRNYFNPHTESMICDSPESYNELRQYISLIYPNNLEKVQYHDNHKPMLPPGVETQISEIYEREIRTSSGIRLVFDSTEAMVTVDVNSARLRRNDNIEETALKANLEAASIVAKQLRLRDLAGLIVVDFIDMDKEENRDKVKEKFASLLKEDRAQIRHTGISQLGLMEISRQRLSRSLEESHGKTCPHCEGTGRVRRSVTFALQLLRRLRAECPQSEGKKIFMQAPETAAVYLLNKKRVELRRLEDDYNCNIFIVPDKDMLPSDSRIKNISDSSNYDKEVSGSQQKNKTDKWSHRLESSQSTTMKPLLNTVSPAKSAPVDGFFKKTKKLLAPLFLSGSKEKPKPRTNTNDETRQGHKHHHRQAKNSGDGEKRNSQNRKPRGEQSERKRQEPQARKRQPAASSDKRQPAAGGGKRQPVAGGDKQQSAAGDTNGRRSAQGDRHSSNKQRNKSTGDKTSPQAETQLAGKSTAPPPATDALAKTAAETKAPIITKPPAITTDVGNKAPATNTPATSTTEPKTTIAKSAAATAPARLADTMKQIETK